MLKLRFFIYLLLYSTSLLGQEPISVYLTEKDGLPDNEFYDVVEDDDGFMWLASNKGLFRYDGSEFKAYHHPKQVGSAVFQLNKDDDNTIWYITLANQIFYVKDDKVTLFKQLSESYANIQLTTHKEFVVIQGHNDFLVYNRKNSKKIYSQKAKKDKINSAPFIMKPIIFNNKVYYSDKGGVIYQFDLDSLQLKLFKTNYSQIRTLSMTMPTIINDSGIFFHHSINKKIFYNLNLDFNNKPQEIKSQLPDKQIVFTKLINNDIWYCTEAGVYVCELISNELKIKHHLFKKNYITKLVIDKAGNYWFTTLKNGVFVVPNIKIQKLYFSKENRSIQKINKGKDGELLIAQANNEILKYNTITHNVSTINTGKNTKTQDFGYNPFSKEYYIKKTFDLLLLDESLNIKHALKGITAFTKKISIVNENEMIITISNNIVRATIIRGNKTYVKIKPLQNIRGYTSFYSKRNKLSYFATIKGLFCFNEDNNKTEIKLKNQSVFVNAIVETKNGDLWCSSLKNGIYVLRNNHIINHYSTKNGLLSNKNTHLITHQNNIWIAGDRGIQKFDSKTKTFKKLNKQNGVPSYNFNGFVLIKDTIYVSTPSILFYFNIDNVFKVNNISEPYFKEVIIADKSYSPKSTFKLKHNQNKIKFTFNTNGFLTNQNIYHYRLLGLSDTWETTTTGVNQVLYHSLKEGNYTFQLKAVNEQQESNIKEINVKVKGIFYKQIWFYALIVILSILTSWLYFNMKNKRLKKTQQLIEEKQNKELENIFLKIESLRSQMNPHFIFNALNSIQDYIIHNEKKLARVYLVKFSRLIRIYLEHSQKDKISLDEEIKALSLYLELEQNRFEDEFFFEINIKKNTPLKQIMIPTFLIQPYVENAIKHGLLHKSKNKKLVISFSEEDDNIKCIISDNGIGRIASEKINAKKFSTHNSFSFKANKKRIALLNKTRGIPIKLIIKDEYGTNNKAKGTTVYITIPKIN